MNRVGPTNVKVNRHIAAPSFTKQETVVANHHAIITKQHPSNNISLSSIGSSSSSAKSASSRRPIEKAQSSDAVHVLNAVQSSESTFGSTSPFAPLEGSNSITYERYCGPTPESNWVVPGLLLVGAYPASQDDHETVLLITSILKQGVTKFVCLQEEYRSHGVTESMWRQGHALRPYFEDVKRIVETKHRVHELDGCHVVDSASLSFVHFPIRDCGITDDGRVVELAKSLVAAMADGEVLYLHCWGGHGRTGTLVCIILHLMYGLDAQEAMTRCQRVHDLRQFPVAVGSPQTQTQRDQVTRVINRLLSSHELAFRRTISDISSLQSASSSPVKKSPRPTLPSQNSNEHDGDDEEDDYEEEEEEEEEELLVSANTIALLDDTSAPLEESHKAVQAKIADSSAAVIAAGASSFIPASVYTEQGDSNITTADGSNVNEQFIEYYTEGDVDDESSNTIDRNRSKSGAMDIDGSSFMMCRSISGAMDVGDNCDEFEEGNDDVDDEDTNTTKNDNKDSENDFATHMAADGGADDDDAEGGEGDDEIAFVESRLPESTTGVVPLKPEKEKPSTLFGFRRIL